MPGITRKGIIQVGTGKGTVRTWGTIGVQHVVSPGSNPAPSDLRWITELDGVLIATPLAQNSVSKKVSDFDPSDPVYAYEVANVTVFG